MKCTKYEFCEIFLYTFDTNLIEFVDNLQKPQVHLYTTTLQRSSDIILTREAQETNFRGMICIGLELAIDPPPPLVGILYTIIF